MSRQKFKMIATLLTAAAMALMPLADAALAATATWDGGADPDGAWMNPANWDGDVAPVPGADDLIFGGVLNTTTNNDFAIDSEFLGILFSPGADSFTLAGNAITLGTPTPFSGVGSGNITNSSSNIQTISLGLTLAAGNHVITGGADGGSALALNPAGGLLRDAGATAVFANTVTTSTITNNASGILGGWATVGTDWATVDGGNQIVAYTGYTDVATGGMIASSATSNVRVLTGGTNVTMAAAGTTDINTLTYNVTGTAQIIDIGGGTLRLGAQGGILRSSTANGAGTNQLVLNNGTLTAGGADDTAGELIINANRPSATGTGTDIVITANVTDNGTGAVTVVKTGRGYAQFNASVGGNTYTGGTYINEGRLQGAVGAGTLAYGTGDVHVQTGGQAFFGVATANNFFIAGSGPALEAGTGAIRGGGIMSGMVTLVDDARISGGPTIQGQITGNFNLELGATGNVGGGGTNITLSNSANDWSGNTTLVGRTGGSAGNTAVNLGASEVIPHGVGKGNIILSNATVSTTILNLNGFDETINGLESGAGIANLGIVQNNAAATTAVLTLGAADATAIFNGILRNNSGTGGTLALTKTGTGTQTLGGVNTYTGATLIQGGRLHVTGSLAAGSAVTVEGGAVLSGTGTVAGVVTVNHGGSVNGGGSSLTLGGLTLGAAGTDMATLNVIPNVLPTMPAINVTGLDALVVNAGANTVTVNVGGPTPAAIGQYVLLDYNGTIQGTGDGFGAFLLGSLPNRTNATLVHDVGNSSINLDVTSVDMPRWTGAHSSEWSTAAIGGPKNWVLNSDGITQTDYLENDSVLFDDSATNTNVDVSVADVTPGAVLFDNTTKDYTLAGTMGIAGASGLTKTGGGTLTITNSNSYSGVTSVNGGVLSISNSTALGDASASNTIALASGTLQSTADVDLGATRSVALGTGGGTFDVTAANTLTVSGAVSGSAGNGLTKTGTGTLVLSGANSYAGNTTISEGVILVTNNAALGPLPGGSVTVESGAALDIGGNPTNNNVNFGAKQFFIEGTGVAGSGALTNSNDSVGQINAFQRVTLTGDASIGGIGRFDIRGSGSMLDLAGFTFTKSGTNQFSLVGTNVTDGNIVIDGGRFAIETTSSIMDFGTGNTITLNAGTILSFHNLTGPITRPVIVNGPGVQMGVSSGGTQSGTLGARITLKDNLEIIQFGTGDLILTGDIGEVGGSFGIVKSSTSIMQLSGNNTYTGGTTVSAGIARAGSSTAFGAGDVTVNIGGTLDLNGMDVTIGGLLGDGGLVTSGVAGPATLIVGSGNAAGSYAGVIENGSGTVGLTKIGSGTQTLTGANTYTGPTTLSAGTLLVNGTHTGAGAYSVASGGTLGGDGSIALADPAGITVTSGGTLAPGASIGTLDLDGGATNGAVLTLASGALLSFELNTGFQSDKVVLANGAASDIVFNGNTIDFTDLSSGSLATGDYTLFTAAAADNYAGLTVDGGDVITAGLMIGAGLGGYTNTALKLVGSDILLSLTAAVVGLPGDYNNNGIVDAADYTIWRDLLGSNTQLANEGAGVTPGTVTTEDYDFWKTNFGATLGSGAVVGQLGGAVPEPSTLVLFGMAMALAAGVRRRKS